MAHRTLFIINPVAGGGRAQARWPTFRRFFRRHGGRQDHIVTDRPGAARQIAHEAAHKYELVVAVGGDGTVLEVAGGILSSAATQTALGIVPFGTGNDFARNSGIHSEDHAHDALTQGQTRFVDVIEARCVVEGKPSVRHALLFAGVGIISESLKQTTTQVKRLFGQRFAYPVGMLRALWSYRSPLMRITCDGQLFEGRFLFAGVSNSETAGGGMRIAPGAQTDDGLLNVNLIRELGRWEALKQLRRVCQGQHTSHPSVRYFPAVSLRVEAESPLEVAADGDLIGHTPAQLRVLPKALEVRVPACRSKSQPPSPREAPNINSQIGS